MIKGYETRFSEAITMLEEGPEDTSQYFTFDCFGFRKISSTNLIVSERGDTKVNMSAWCILRKRSVCSSDYVLFDGVLRELGQRARVIYGLF